MYIPKKRESRFQFSPAQVLVLGFAALILTGAFLLWLPISSEPGKSITFLDALFTATSAVCVTGLIVVDTPTQFSAFGEWTVLGLIQAGGLGIMTMSALMLLLIGKRISLRERVLMQEALGSFSIAGVVRLTRHIIFTTLAIEAIGALLLFLRFAGQMNLKQAAYWGVFHSVSAFNNAGFDVTSQSLRGFQRDPFVLGILGFLIILGGIGFFVMEDVWTHRRWERLSLHTKLAVKMTVYLIGAGTLLFLALEWTNPVTFGPLPWYHKIANAWFAAVTPRTAGFESVLSGTMVQASILLTVILMFIGASPGGTGGGIKTSTFALIALTIRATATGKEEVELMGRRLSRDLVDKAVTVAAIAMALIMAVWGLMLVTESQALNDAANNLSALKLLFEVVSAFATVGLTAGMTPFLTSIGKVLIIALMFVGRVGPLTMAVALAQRQETRTPIHFPEDRVMIG